MSEIHLDFWMTPESNAKIKVVTSTDEVAKISATC